MAENGSVEAVLEALRHMFDKVERLQRLSSNAVSETANRLSRCELAVLMIGARKTRGIHLPSLLVGEPSWDMLLELYVSYCNDKAISVSSVCIASGIPATTALRYLATMQDAQLIQRRPDVNDKRRDFVVISDVGLGQIEAYLDGYVEWVTALHQKTERQTKSS